MANTLTGRIYQVKPTETREYNGKTYYERTLVLDATKHDPYTGEPMYPNFPSFQFMGEDRCKELDNYKTRQIVTVSFELQGVKYVDKQTGEEKCFNKVRGYKVALYQNPTQLREESLSPAQPTAPPIMFPDDDLPF